MDERTILTTCSGNFQLQAQKEQSWCTCSSYSSLFPKPVLTDEGEEYKEAPDCDESCPWTLLQKLQEENKEPFPFVPVLVKFNIFEYLNVL